MEKQKIEQGKILIAEFMGRKFIPYKDNRSVNLGFATYNECERYIEENRLKDYFPELGWGMGCGEYDKLIDWIMPVAEKIGRLSNWNFSLDISQSKQTVAVIFDNDYKFTASGSRFESSSYVTAKAIFSVVVMFLNKTKTYAEPHVNSNH